MSTSPEDFNKRIRLLSDEADVLAEISTLEEAKRNILKLKLLENELLSIERQIKVCVSDLERYLKELENEVLQFKGSWFSSFFNSKEKRQAKFDEFKRYEETYRKRIERYSFAFTYANSVRGIVGLVIVPDLEISIRETEEKRINQPKQAKRISGTKYYDYIQTTEWKAKAEEAKARANNRCQICNKSRAEVQLDAHHRTYERLGSELPEDITVLCRNCHQLYEDERRLEKPTKKCQTCGRDFAPIKPSHSECLDCFLAKKNRRPASALPPKPTSDTPVVTCKRCGKEFVQAKASYHYCYDCYKQYRTYR